ncbi:AsmA-like C-terminal domain-containing protein [Niveispirillum irakense]|uniref:YhdP family protein n=1 Tax=Niveispirillum irakense TaxID=34011 RepID=UPI00048DA934|nr:AsmA-like C-terminal domain-containing protein [Niveispirillum irakense]
MLRHSALIVLELLAGLLLVLALGSGLLAWRLTQGPVSLDFVTPYLEQELNRQAPTRLDLGETILAWNGFGTRMDLRLRGVTAYGTTGAVVAAVPEVRLGLSVPALLRGTIAPTRIELVEPRLYAERTADGEFRLDIRTDDTELDPEAGARIMRELLEALRAPPDPLRQTGALRDLRITRARLVVNNVATGTIWQVPRLDLRLRRNANGVFGTAAADIDMGGKLNQIAAEIVYRTEDGAITARTTLADLQPADFADLAPVLDPLRALEVTLNGSITLEMNADFAPTAMVLGLSGRQGRLVLPDNLPEPLSFDSVDLHGRLEQSGRRLVLDRFDLDLTGPADLNVTGTAQQDGDTIHLALTTETTGLPMADLHKLWPKGVQENTRDWMVENLADGTFDRTVFKLEGTAPADDPLDITPSSMEGQFALSGFTVHYRRPLPPVTQVAAEARFDGAEFTIDIKSGTLMDLNAGPATVRIMGLDKPKGEAMDIHATLEGPLSSALAVLDHEPLGYASKVGLVPASVQGHAKAELHFAFPLIAALTMDDVQLDGSARLTGVSVPDIVADISATEGTLDLAVTGHDLNVTGTALLNGVPADIAWTENFTDHAPFGTRVRVLARPDDEGRGRFKLDFPDWLNGPVGVDMVYTRVGSGAERKETIEADLDLMPSTLRIDVLDWKKPPEKPGRAKATIHFVDGKPVLIPALHVETEELHAVGQASLRHDDFGLDHLLLEEFRLGRSDARVDLRSTDRQGGMAIDVRGLAFDVRPFRGKKDKDAAAMAGMTEAEKHRARDAKARKKEQEDHLDLPEPPAEKLPPLAISFDLGLAVMGDEGRIIRNVRGRMERDADIWFRTDLDAEVSDEGRLVVRYGPDPADARVLTLDVESNDAGATLNNLDVISQIKGGTVKVTGRSDPADLSRTVVGTAELRDYQVQDAPVLARLLSAVSLPGLANLMSGQGLAFSRLHGKYQWTDTGISLREMRTSGSQVGLTLEGNIDLKKSRADLQGTVVPFSSVNRLLSAIPVLGDILVGGEGQGLFAATYTIKGPLDDLQTGVNPLAVLAPGFLRNLFFLPEPAGENMPKEAKPPRHGKGKAAEPEPAPAPTETKPVGEPLPPMTPVPAEPPASDAP